MGTKFNLYIYTVSAALTIPLAIGATSGSVSPSGTVAAINEIVVNMSGTGVTITESTGLDAGAGSFTGTDFMELEFQNNDSDGYTITVTPTKGFLQNASLTTDGAKVNYTLACDAYDTLDDTTETISAYSATAVSGTGAITVYTVSDPEAATCVNTGQANGCKLAPDCDLALGSGENVDELFAGSYTETFTVAIANAE